MFSHLIGQAEIKHRNTSYSEGLIQIVRLDKYTALGAFVYLSCQQLIFVLSLINILVSTGPSNRNHLELERTGEDGYCLVCRKKNEEKLVYIRETHSRMTWGGGGYDGHEGHGYNGHDGQDGHDCQDGYDGYAVCPVLIFPGKL